MNELSAYYKKNTMKKFHERKVNISNPVNHLLLFILLISFGITNVGLAQNNTERNMEYYVNNAPFHMPDVQPPNFPDKSFNITDYGAKGHGKVLNTDAIQKTIDACSKSGGGTVIVPPGLWLTAPIELKSHVNFYLDRGAILLYTTDHTKYPIIKSAHSDDYYVVESPIYGHDLTDVAITGHGIIDGNGQSWRPVKRMKVTKGHWEKLLRSGGAVNKSGSIWWPSKQALNGKKYLSSLKKKNGKLKASDFLPARDYMRPYMVYILYSKNVYIDGPTFKNSPKFALYPKYCENIIVRNIKINNEYWAQNGDALDIASSKNVILYNNTITAGDDGICMKSSPHHWKNSGYAALQNVIIADNVVYHGHGGFVVGSNTDGGINNVYVTNNDFINTDRGLRFKSRRGRGGLVHNIYVDHIYMTNIYKQAIYFNTFYEQSGTEKGAKHPVNSKTPRFRDIHISHIYCDGAETAVSMTGLPEMPVQNISLSHIRIVAKHGFVADQTKNIRMNDVAVIPESGTDFDIKDSQDIQFDKVEIPGNLKTFIKLSGRETSNIMIKKNSMPGGKNMIQFGPEVNKNVLQIQE